MLKMIVSGCNGHMGQCVVCGCAELEGVEIVAGFNRTPVKKNCFEVYSEPMSYEGPADVVVDFSNPANLDGLLEFCLLRKIPIVLCTTGYSEEQLKDIEKAAARIPVFKSGNMSLGINLMMQLVKRASAVLGESFDVEIVEKHHRRKVDAPSGTALMLADAAASSLPYKAEEVFERHSVRQPRRREEIGISSIRGGTIVGEHEVVFAGTNEVISIQHSAQSREVFAAGALHAAKFLAGRAAGFYDMRDLVASIE